MTLEEHHKAIMAKAQPSLEDRVKWLEADAAAQRTAISRLERDVLRLERALNAVFYAMATFGFCFLVLVLAVLT
jgi:hypothetical protein